MIYPINLIPHWGDTWELNPELKNHSLPCCRYTSAAIERDGERGGNRTRHCHGFADRALVQYWELAHWLRRQELNLFHQFQRLRHYRYATPHFEIGKHK